MTEPSANKREDAGENGGNAGEDVRSLFCYPQLSASVETGAVPVPANTLFIVQQLDRAGKKLVAGRQMDQPSASAAGARAERDAARCAGVVAIQ